MNVIVERDGKIAGRITFANGSVAVEGDARLKSDVESARKSDRGGWADVDDFIKGPIKGASEREARATIEAVSHHSGDAYRFKPGAVAKGPFAPLLAALESF